LPAWWVAGSATTRIQPMKKADVVICGGAVIGSAIAWNLGQLAPALSVIVVERDPTFELSSTALSASGIRQQFSNTINVAISQFGVDFIRGAKARWGMDLNLREQGYLYLANTAEGSQTLRDNHALQQAEGADVSLLEPEALAARFPHLNVDDLKLASLGLSGEGWFDSVGLMNGYQSNSTARRISGEITSLRVSHGKIQAVVLATGEEIACGSLINAAGPRAAGMAKMAGIDLPVEPRKRTNFTFDCADPLASDLPLMIDPSGVWARPEGRHFLCGCSPANDPAVDHNDFEPRHAEFEDIIWPALAARSPNFEAIKVQRFWAGHYAYNTLDQNAVTGSHPEISNFIFANGFSGHGLQQSPAIGRGIAELVALGAYKSLDLSPLGYERILNQNPLLERCVI